MMSIADDFHALPLMCVLARFCEANGRVGGGGRKWEGAQQNSPPVDVTPASLLPNISN